MNGGREKQKGLQTVERALEVLYLFREYEGITLSFVTEKLGMCPAVAYRLLYTLTDSGFLRIIAGWMYFSPSEWICRACVWKSWM